MKNQTNRTLRKILSIALCLALVMSYVPVVSIPVSAKTLSVPSGYTAYNIEGGLSADGYGLPTLTISQNGNCYVYGTCTQKDAKILVKSGVTANIILDDVNLNVRETTQQAGIVIESGADVTLLLAGDNYIEGGICSAGISVPEGATLTITSFDGDSETTGNLTVVAKNSFQSGCGGAGIGADGQTTYEITNEKKRTVGDIIINGGTISTLGGIDGAGIGGAGESTTGSVTINGGNITANVYNPGDGVNGAAAIGGGIAGYLEAITITGGTVYAGQTNSAAAIGGGWYGHIDGSEANYGEITITGGNITAVGDSGNNANGANGVGRGGVYNEDASTITGSVIITGGNIVTNNGITAPKNEKNEALQLLVIDVIGLSKDAAVTEILLSDGEKYGVKDVSTVNKKLYIAIPENEEVESITIGGETYFYSGEGSVCAHNGNKTEATCLEESVCELCGNKISEKDLENHVDKSPTYQVNSTDSTKHDCYYDCCGAVVEMLLHEYKYSLNDEDKTTHNHICSKCSHIDFTEKHNYTDGVCEDCKYNCPHETVVDFICQECNMVMHSCSFSDNYVYNDEVHWIECDEPDCTKTSNEEAHSFESGLCLCGYACPHTNYVNYTCERCGVPCEHKTFTDGFCTLCGDYKEPERNTNGYYEIYTAGNLFWFAREVNKGGDYNYINAILKNDIDLKNKEFTPIGDEANENGSFQGVFDGQGYHIKGLNVKAGKNLAGLFGEARNATIKNLEVSGKVVITSAISYVGGVVGSAPGTTGNGTKLLNVISHVDMEIAEGVNGAKYVGGFAGYANHSTVIENCLWDGEINAGVQWVEDLGGFIGRIQTSSAVIINNCASYGKIISNYKQNSYNSKSSMNLGGFAGYIGSAKDHIKNCIFAGALELGADFTDKSNVSAFGYWNAIGSVDNCYYLKASVPNTNAGAAAPSVCEMTSVTAEQLSSGEIAYKLNSSLSYGVWKQTIGTHAYPVFDGATVYYCNEESGFTNTDPHNMLNDVCTVCGEYKAPQLNEEGYYEIYNVAQLFWFAKLVNTGNNMADCILMDNISLAGKVWTPIGNKYSGIFDGNGKKISGMSLTVTSGHSGFFSLVGISTIKNLIVEGNISLNGTDSSNVISGVGGIVGRAEGATITGCISRVDISGTTAQGRSIAGVVGDGCASDSIGTVVTKCANYGNITVSGGKELFAGVVAYQQQYGKIENCANYGNVSAPGASYVGGILGYINNANFEGVSNCLNTGSVTGGSNVAAIVGRLNAHKINTFRNNFHINSIVAYDSEKTILSGEIFEAFGVDTQTLASGKVAYTLNDSKHEGNLVWYQTCGEGYPELTGKVVYPVFGCNGETIIGYNNTEETVSDHTFSSAGNGFCDNCGGYQSAVGRGTDEDPYQISNAGQLYWFAAVVNNGYGNTAQNNAACAVLTDDIVVNKNVLNSDGKLNSNGSDLKVWSPIGIVDVGYIGNFNGQGHTISGLYINDRSSSNLALFVQIGNENCTDSYVKNLGIIDSYFYGMYDASGIAYANYGTIENCFNNSTIIGGVNSCGISYYNYALIKNCYNIGIIGNASTRKACGIAFVNYDTIENCYNAGVIKSISEIYGISTNSGNVTVTNCYYLDGRAEGRGTPMSAEQFASGEVAYLLQGEQADGVWGQDLSVKGSLPEIGGKKVYKVISCDSVKYIYLNTNQLSAHYDENPSDHICDGCEEVLGECDYRDNGFCSVCGACEPAELNANSYYEIGNAGQLFWFANYINTVDRTANAVLTADIDLENRPWTPIGSTGENSHNFRGIFDGQNHTIKGLYVEGGRAGLGFFGEVRTGTVKNFTIYGEVVANTDVNYVGGVIGSICGLNGDNDLERNGAIIQNIPSYVNLTAKTHGIGMIGGFVGYANHESLIENCSWYGTFDAGEYRVDSGAGGFIGKIQENTSAVTIRNCGAYGTIKTNYAKNSYNNTPTIYMGGFLSFSNTKAQTVLENCLFAGKFERGENLTDEARLGAFGTLSSVNAIVNCYYLGDDGLEAVHSDSSLKPGENIEITSVAREQLASGEVAYLLGEAWGQMSNTEGSLPIITDNELYKVVTVGETGNYSVANVGDTNGDGTVDVIDYQALVNKALADDHEQIETASYDDIVKYDLDGDGYLDVIDASLMNILINGHKTVDVYAVGDYDLNGKAFEEADIFAMAEAMKAPEDLETHKKYACDINGDGKVSYDDLNTLTSMFPLYFVGEA